MTANSNLFAVLAESLHVSYDDFIRTSTDPRHAPTVEAIWHACLASGDLYRAPYAGWYCAGCEQFVDGACDEHDAPPEWVEEENWYFRLSRYADRIRALIRERRAAHRSRRASQRSARVPRCATCATSASRVSSPARAAGASRCPDDPDQIIYVWFDALDQLPQRRAGRVVVRAVVRRHVIGKGIVRFHALDLARDPAVGRASAPDRAVRARLRHGERPQDRQVARQCRRPDRPRRALRRRRGALVVAARGAAGSAKPTSPRRGSSSRANRDLANGIGNLVQRLAGLGGAIRSRATTTSTRIRLQRAIDAAIDAFDLRAATGVDQCRDRRGQSRDRARAAVDTPRCRPRGARSRHCTRRRARSSTNWRRSSPTSRARGGPAQVDGKRRVRPPRSNRRHVSTRRVLI